MEKERIGTKSEDQTGFSEKQLDVNIETGVFKKNSQKKKIKKILFEKKSKK